MNSDFHPSEAPAAFPSTPFYSNELARAFQVAARLYAGQTRKQTDIPYLSHLLGTCAIAIEYGANQEEAIGALLHDAIEDVEPPRRRGPRSGRSARW